MRRARILSSGVCVLTLALGACQSPPSRFYTLSAVATPIEVQSDVSIAVGPVSVPDVVDRPQFVLSRGANQIELDEFHRWAAPLEDNVSLVVAENLVALLGAKRVLSFPSSVTTAVDFRVAIEVQRFETARGYHVLFDAVWMVTRVKDGRTETGRTTQREDGLGDDHETLAGAHSRAIGVMSQDIAERIRSLDQRD